MDKKDRLIACLLFAAFLGAGLLAALQLNIPPVLDEVGTLANSAYMAGYDWTETVYTMGGFYYKYGISLLYAPFLKFIDDPYIVYKAMLSLNCLLYAFVPVMAYAILRKHLRKTRMYAVLVSAACAMIPSCFIFQLYAKADSILIVLPWVVLYLLMELNGTEKGKKKTLFSFSLSFICIFAYMVHTRGIVIIIAVILTLLIVGLISKKCLVNIPVFLGTMAVMLVADKLIGNVFYENVYGYYGTLHASAESFEFDYLLKIFTAEGFGTMIKLITGWLFTGLTSTFGLIGIAVIGGIVWFIRDLRKKPWKNMAKRDRAGLSGIEEGNGNDADDDQIEENDNGERIFLVYAVLSFLGVFAMGILFFFPPVHRYLTEEALLRSDRLIYERYMAAAFGPAVMLGLHLVTKKLRDRKAVRMMLWVRISTAVLFAGVVTVFLLKVVKYIEGVKGNSRYLIGVSTFLQIENGSTNAVMPDISHSLLLSALMGFGVFAVICIASYFVNGSGRIKYTVCTAVTSGAVIVVFLVIGVVAYNKIRLSRDEVLMEWTQEPVSFMLDLPEGVRKYPVFWDASAKDIKHYQFLLKSYRIGSYCTVTSKADNCFVIAKKNHYLKEYYDNDYYCFDDFDYEGANRDVVYVKGKELAKYLEKNGVGVTKYKGKTKKAELPDPIMPYVGP